MTGHLVVVDLQDVFADPASPWFTPRFAEILEPVDRLVEAFSPRVVFTRFVAPEAPSGSWINYYDRWPFALQPPTWPMFEIVDRYRSIATETLDETTFSKWTGRLAERIGPDRPIVLAGVSTDCCVLSTALAASDTGVSVVVASDACAGVDDPSHEAALAVLALFDPLVKVTTAAEAAAFASR